MHMTTLQSGMLVLGSKAGVESVIGVEGFRESGLATIPF